MRWFLGRLLIGGFFRSSLTRRSGLLTLIYRRRFGRLCLFVCLVRVFVRIVGLVLVQYNYLK